MPSYPSPYYITKQGRGSMPKAMSGAAGPSGGFVMGRSAQVDKDRADYTDHASNPSERCALCRHFKGDHSCEVVSGKISPAGWCKYFKRQTAAKSTQTGVMVAFMLPEYIGQALLDLANEAGIPRNWLLPLSELHLTLAYLGDLTVVNDRGINT